MRTFAATGDSRLSVWRRTREFAVPPPMIETATARRRTGDWAGACAAAGIDVDFRVRDVARTYGREVATRLRDDLRHLAPDLLRWHMPRVAPDGLLRPGLTFTLARYRYDGTDDPGSAEASHLVVRTPPTWAAAGQRISLALWDGSPTSDWPRGHPHPHPAPRFRLDLHRHVWDARRAGELALRCGADGDADDLATRIAVPDPELVPHESWALDRWAAEAAILLAADGLPSGPVAVRPGGRERLVLEPPFDGDDAGAEAGGDGVRRPVRPGGGLTLGYSARDDAGLPVLPYAATWLPPDLELLRAGLIDADDVHPLVATALVPGYTPRAPGSPPDTADRPRIVECRGARHRIGLVDGVLTPLDHDPAEVGREELLVALTGTALPCLVELDRVHRKPHSLDDVRARLRHGDAEGALAVVEGLIGPDAVLRAGPLRDEVEAAVQGRIAYGMFRAGLTGPPPAPFSVFRQGALPLRSRALARRAR